MDLNKASLKEISHAVQTRAISSKEVCQHFYNKSESLNSEILAYISLNKDIQKQADEIDSRIAKGENLGPLAGVPIAVKDLICTKGLRTTAASKMLENFTPPYDATIVERLKKAGALVLGKCNLDEFAMGSSNETSFFGTSKNPWNKEYVAGGSSGGSAAAVAAQMAPAALGTDTGGSIRQPASFCSLVGVKPTYGRVSRYGIVAFASSLDQAGPMTRSVEDAALLLEVMSGRDHRDSTTADMEVPQFSSNLKADFKGLKFGVIKEFMTQSGLSPDSEKTFANSIEVIQKLGGEIVEVNIPLAEYAVPIYYLICTSEASSNLARYDGVRFGHRSEKADQASSLDDFYALNRGEGFGDEVKRRIMLGTYALSSGYYDAYYSKASQVRRLLQQQYLEAMKQCDLLISPVTTSPAFRIGERIDDPLAMYLNDIFTTSANLVGFPAMSLPAGFSEEGLPIGLQITASHFQEQKMLQAAYALEEAFHLKGKVPHGL